MHAWGIEEAERRKATANGSNLLLMALWRAHPEIMKRLGAVKCRIG